MQLFDIEESIKQAEKVKLEDIPLPGMPSGLMSLYYRSLLKHNMIC
jgi:hypothetical protein